MKRKNMATGESSQRDRSTWEPIVETPHTQRVAESETSIKIQMKLAMLGERERNEVMKRQIEAFREKVRLCRAAYSTELAESMLSQIKSEDGSYVDSIYKLKKYVQQIPKIRQNSQIVVYAKWYLNNIGYLNELKTNFDERIYLPLIKLYTSFDNGEEGPGMPEGSREGTNVSELRAMSAASVLRFKNDLPEVKDLYDFAEVDNIASRLAYIRQRWQFLFDEKNEINASLFSYNSMLKLSPHFPREIANLLRLVPDILLKCDNAAILSLQWLECASTKALDLHTKYTKLERVKSILTEKLSGLSDEIKSEENELEIKFTDLEFLADREERANEIMSKTHQIDQYIQQLKSKIQQLRDETNRLQQQSVTAEQQGISKQIRENKIVILQLENDIRMNLFQKGLLNEDLSIELEVKPCMIRYTDQLQENCETLEQRIDTKRTEKQRVESALVPVIADSKRTQAKLSRENSLAATPQHSAIGDLRTEPNDHKALQTGGSHQGGSHRAVPTAMIVNQY